MTGFTKKTLILLFLLFVVAYAANGIIKGDFEFPEIMVVLMNLIVVPLLCQWIKKITPVREIRAILAWALSFITAIVGIIIAGEGSFQKIFELLILAYSVSQIAYNLWWHRLLQPKAK